MKIRHFHAWTSRVFRDSFAWRDPGADPAPLSEGRVGSRAEPAGLSFEERKVEARAVPGPKTRVSTPSTKTRRWGPRTRGTLRCWWVCIAKTCAIHYAARPLAASRPAHWLPLLPPSHLPERRLPRREFRHEVHGQVFSETVQLTLMQ